MFRDVASIILEAKMVSPDRVPATLSSTFERLGNTVIPQLGIQMAVEFFPTGWLSFFRSVTDFRRFFSRPLFSKPRKDQVPSPVCEEKEEGTVIWDFQFVRLPTHSPEASLAKILKRFYTRTGSLGEGTVEEIVAPGAPTRYRVCHPSLAEYRRLVEELIKNTYELVKNTAPQSS